MRSHSFPLAAAAVLLLAACGTGSTGTTGRPQNIPRPDIRVDLANNIFWGSSTTANVNLDVTVTNRADQPITVRRVEVSSPNTTQYRLRTGLRDFKDTIAPGETKVLPLNTLAERYVNRPTDPLTLRAIVDIEAAGSRWREIVTVIGNRSPM
jgi:hypothetical protein